MLEEACFPFEALKQFQLVVASAQTHSCIPKRFLQIHIITVLCVIFILYRRGIVTFRSLLRLYPNHGYLV